MQSDSIELSLLSIFSFLSFFTFFTIQKISNKIFSGSLSDDDFNKPQAFHSDNIPRSGGLAAIISFLIFIALLIYFKIPLKVKNILDDNINKIRQQVDESEKLKEEAKNKLAEYEKKIDSSKIEVKKMIEKANEKAEKNILASNEIFHNQMELKKKNFEDKIKQLKNQAIKDVSIASINIAFESIEKLMLNSLDKSKLDKIFNKSLEETKLALQKKSS